MDRHTAEDALAERRYYLVAILERTALEATQCTTVFLSNDDIVRHIDQTAGKLTGVGSIHSCIGKTLTGTVGCDEVLEH